MATKPRRDRFGRFTRKGRPAGSPPKRDKYGRFRSPGKPIAPPPKRDKYGRFRSPGKPIAPPPKRGRGGRFVPNLEPALLLQRIVDKLDAAGFAVASAEPMELLIRESEIWHHYTVELSDAHELPGIEDAAELFHQVLLRWYTLSTQIVAYLGLVDEESGEIYALAWRTLTSAERFDPAFSQLAFAVDVLTERVAYAEVWKGLAVHVRAPEWYA